LENALQGWAAATGANRHYDLRSGIKATRNESKSLQKFEGSRAYERPDNIPSNITRREHQLAARMQLEGGSRINEIGLIRSGQLRPGFKFETQGKGGKILTPQLSEKTWRELQTWIEKNGQFQIDHDDYRASLELAAAETGQSYNGSHGLRWNYAQRRMQELTAQGEGYYVCLAKVSKEMGHERPDITQHYLK
jgi:integrase